MRINKQTQFNKKNRRFEDSKFVKLSDEKINSFSGTTIVHLYFVGDSPFFYMKKTKKIL